ncbi:MAG: hypothetical protein V2J65_24630 [Desulfobacteraceae bacterium]|nr:hypothetical protein [Desulfobacteraceae bacterium]
MVQKKRHFINGKSLVKVIYRKRIKSPRQVNEPPKAGDRSDQTRDLADDVNVRSRKK